MKLKKIMEIISGEDKRTLLMLIPFALIIALIEMIGISAVMPFVHIATDINVVTTNPYYAKLFTLLHFESKMHFIVFFGISLICFYLLRAVLQQIYVYVLAKFSRRCSWDISLNLFKNYIGFSYRNFIERNSSKLISSVLHEASNIASLITAYVTILTEALVAFVIYVLLLFVSWKITMLLTLFLTLNALIVFKTISKKIKHSGVMRGDTQHRFYEILLNTFGNFKIIKLNAKETSILKTFNIAGNEFIKANVTSETLSQTPRIYLEAVGFIILILIVLYWVLELETGITSKIGVVSVFMLALYRLLPSVSKVIYNYNQILFLERSLQIVHSDLGYTKEKIGNAPLAFTRDITLENVCFEYLRDKPVLRKISLTIAKGEKIAFIGESGSGKSTLVDLIIGLYKPKAGVLKVDGVEVTETNIRSWRKKIGYIPQDIYLFNSTVAENVAFEDNYDSEKVIRALKQAKIYEFLQREHSGIETIIGPGGINLSGGQKQRIAIARALYHDPELLVLDEATSALDLNTEQHIMQEIFSIGTEKTVIIVTHRPTTIRNCDHIYLVEDGAVHKSTGA